MNRFTRWAALTAAAVTVSTGLAMPVSAATAPATQATTARDGFVCPLIAAVCAFSQPGGVGRRVILVNGRARIVPPLRSAANNSSEFWCFYSEPGFRGERREVSAGETVEDFGFAVNSAKPGLCSEQ
ncbi:peptidase inhibitor family I36 protein [Streptosporangium sp. NPDC020072]|uniref:peptidase inhibitor family I36 protein n=1 Tax=Streptosporangium sp. NPDC020072 TaxID=3154788 RepID=UPI00343D6CD0